MSRTEIEELRLKCGFSPRWVPKLLREMQDGVKLFGYIEKEGGVRAEALASNSPNRV